MGLLIMAVALLTLMGCASLPDNVERPLSNAYTDTDDTRLARARRVHENERELAGESGFLTSPELVGRIGRIGPALDDAIDRIAFRLVLDTDEDGHERIVWHDAETGEPYFADPDTGYWERFWIGLVGLIPLESQL